MGIHTNVTFGKLSLLDSLSRHKDKVEFNVLSWGFISLCMIDSAQLTLAKLHVLGKCWLVKYKKVHFK